MRRLGLVGIVCLMTLAGLTGLGASAQAFTVFCTGKTKAQVAACDTSGYAAVMDKMHWRMYGGHNCTNYVAYRLQKNGVPEPRILMGNARDWHTNAKKLGYVVDNRPAVGAIAQWSKASSHVAYVEEVGPNHLVLSEDSYTSKTFRRYQVVTGASWYPERFIHFKDLGAPAAPVPAPAPKPVKAKATVAVSGPAKVSTRIAPKVTVKVAAANGAVPEGRVRVRRGGKTVATVQLKATAKGKASVTLPRMAKGKQWISAVYDGGPTVLAGTSKTIKVTVTKPPKTVSSTTTVAPPATVEHGRRPALSVVVKSADGRTMSNKDSIYVDGKRIGSPKVTKANRGRLSVRLPALAPGSHTVRATYWGSKGVRRSNAKTVRFSVVEPTTVTSTLSAQALRYGATASVTVDVATARRVAPTSGKVEVLADGVPIASAALTKAAAGRVTIALPVLEPGTRRIQARFLGTTFQTASTGAEQQLSVKERSSTGFAAPSSGKTTTRATVKVKVVSARKAYATSGTVTIRSGTKVLATVRLTAATKDAVEVVLPRLAAGTHQLTASFEGNDMLEPSVGAVRTIKVTA